MSQIQAFGMAGVGPAGPILTLTGDDAVPVTPVGGNINILGFEDLATIGFAFVEASVNPATLKIVPLTATVTTVDAAPTFFASTLFPIGASKSIVMTATVIGNRDDYSAACGGTSVGCARRAAAGGAVFVGDNTLGSEDSAAGTPEFAVGTTGNSIGVYVVGLAGQTWKWTCSFTYVVQTVP